MAATTAANVETMRALIANFFNSHDPDAAEAYFAPGFRWHGASVGDISGRDAYAEVMRDFWQALPDAKATEQDVIADGDKVAARFIVQGTHEGELWGIPPTRDRIRWEATMIYHFSDGRIVEQWANEDWSKILADVGAYSPPFEHAGPVSELAHSGQPIGTRQ